MVGRTARMAVPLGLLHREERTMNGRLIRDANLSSSMDHWEREERRYLMWMIVGHDAGTAASSGWLNSLPIDEIVRFALRL
jgi:hypothetical protein